MNLFWLWLALLPKMPDANKLHMLQLAGSPEALYRADRKAFYALSPEEKRWLPLLDKSLDQAQATLNRCNELGIRLIPLDHPEYPAMLRAIPDPPLVLYCKGRLPDPRHIPLVGVVGTRKCSDYALSMAQDLGYGLGLHGAGVVSGMAAGVDGAVTQGALQANALAVGVLGCGPDVIFPKSNAALYDQMEAAGCLISEFPPGTPAAKWNFPRRNRIISGLSVAVVVVEAPERSGALITARHALDQGRDVFVVPGRMGDPGCAGSNQLLRDGAGMVTCAWDILESQVYRYPILRSNIAIPAVSEKSAPTKKPTAPKSTPKPAPKPKQAPAPQPKDLSAEEQQVFSILSQEEQHLDTVALRTGLSASAVLAALTMLEIKGYIITQPGGWARTI